MMTNLEGENTNGEALILDTLVENEDIKEIQKMKNMYLLKPDRNLSPSVRKISRR